MHQPDRHIANLGTVPSLIYSFFNKSEKIYGVQPLVFNKA